MRLHIAGYSFAWLTFLYVWSFKIHPCVSQCCNSLILVSLFYEWEIIPDVCTTHCLILISQWGFCRPPILATGGKQCWRFIGVPVTFNQCVLGIQATLWECQILDVAHLDSLSGIQRLSILLACQCALPPTALGGFFFLQTLLYLLPVDLWHWPLWVLWFDFSLSFSLAFLQLWGMLNLLLDRGSFDVSVLFLFSSSP